MKVALGPPKESIPTLEELVKKTKEIAKKSENIFIDLPHCKERMEERSITLKQIIDVLNNGQGVSGPEKDAYDDWRIKMMKMVAGQKIQVVVAVNSTLQVFMGPSRR